MIEDDNDKRVMSVNSCIFELFVNFFLFLKLIKLFGVVYVGFIKIIEKMIENMKIMVNNDNCFFIFMMDFLFFLFYFLLCFLVFVEIDFLFWLIV